MCYFKKHFFLPTIFCQLSSCTVYLIYFVSLGKRYCIWTFVTDPILYLEQHNINGATGPNIGALSLGIEDRAHKFVG